MPRTKLLGWLAPFLLLTSVLAACPAHAEEDAALIPRDVLFGNPDRAAVRLSPDGSLLSFLAPLDGVMNIWVAPVEDPKAARCVTADKGRGIRRYRWCFDNRRLLFLQDDGGNENWRVNVLDLVTGRVRGLSPNKGVAARIAALSPKFPRHVLLSLNDRDPRTHDIVKVDLVTGDSQRVLKNEGLSGFVIDDDYKIRFAQRPTRSGGAGFVRRTKEGGWTPFFEVERDDLLTTRPLGFDKSGRLLYLLDARGRDTAALKVLDLDSDEGPILLAADERADIASVAFHPTERYVQAISVNHTRVTWDVLDPKMAEDFAFLATVDDGDLSVSSRSLDDRLWIVTSSRSDGPVRYFLYDRAAKDAKFLFTNRRSIEDLTLPKMRPVIIKARDGLDLVCYLSMPLGVERRPAKPLPMVLLVHGGPWGRDSWGYNRMHQWLANRGYAVLSVNFRGSTGFGKRFLNAGNLEWGRKMHDDLLDAVAWAERQRIADPARVGIMGGSYGGYATLVALTKTPKRFACGVDIVGPSNLMTLLTTIPPYWAPMIEMFATRVGDHRTEAGRKLLIERSPLTHVAKIERPLLIGQGKNDPRVKENEAQQIVAAMQKRGIAVTYALYPDEGHGFRRPENSKSFWAVVEQFLAQTLGGRAQPIGDDVRGSSLQVPVGALWIPGLTKALEARAVAQPAGR